MRNRMPNWQHAIVCRWLARRWRRAQILQWVAGPACGNGLANSVSNAYVLCIAGSMEIRAPAAERATHSRLKSESAQNALVVRLSSHHPRSPHSADRGLRLLPRLHLADAGTRGDAGPDTIAAEFRVRRLSLRPDRRRGKRHGSDRPFGPRKDRGRSLAGGGKPRSATDRCRDTQTDNAHFGAAERMLGQVGRRNDRGASHRAPAATKSVTAAIAWNRARQTSAVPSACHFRILSGAQHGGFLRLGGSPTRLRSSTTAIAPRRRQRRNPVRRCSRQITRAAHAAAIARFPPRIKDDMGWRSR